MKNNYTPNLFGPILGIILLYILISVNMYFGTKLYSIELAFVGFIILAIIFYLLKIDSRFLILPALLLLSFVPFLLTIKYSVLAENLAIYVYYFLVVGVIMQFVEVMKKKEPKIDFSVIMTYLYKKIRWVSFFVLFGIVALVFFGLKYLIKSEGFIIWIVLFAYLAGMCLLVFLYSLLNKKSRLSR